MSEKPVSPVTGEPLKVQNYYFQIVLDKLISKTAVVETFNILRFSIFKGKQKFESTKNIPATFVDSSLALPNHRLNFVVLNYNPAKVQEFTLKVSHISEQTEKELGEYIIDCNSYVDHYKSTENGAFVNQWDLGQLFSLDVQIYIEKSRYGVERLHREVKNPKPKKPDQQPIVVPLQKIIPRRRDRTNQDSSLQKSIEKENRYKRVSPKKDAKLQSSKRLEASKSNKDILIEQAPVVRKKQSSEVKKQAQTPKKISIVKQSEINKQAQTANPPEAIIQTPVNNSTETAIPVQVNKPIEIDQKPQTKETCQVKPSPQLAEAVEIKNELPSQDKSAVQKKNSEQFYTPQQISVAGSKNQGNTVKDEVIQIKKETFVEEKKQISIKTSKVLEQHKEEAPAAEEQAKPIVAPEEQKPSRQVSQPRAGYKLEYPSFMKDCPLNIKFIAPIFLLLLIGVGFVLFTVLNSSGVEPIPADPTLLAQNQTILQKVSKKTAKVQKKANIKIKEQVEATPELSSKGTKSKIEISSKPSISSSKTEVKSKKSIKATKSTTQISKEKLEKKKQSPAPKALKPTLKATKTVQATPTQTATYIPTVIPPSGKIVKEASSNTAKSPKTSSTEPLTDKASKEKVSKASTKVKQPKKSKTIPNPEIKPTNTKINISNPPTVKPISTLSVNSISASNSSNTTSNASKPKPSPATPSKKGKKCKTPAK